MSDKTYGQILRDTQIFPKKRLGQHFMTDPRLLESISQAMLPPGKSWVAVEIGPGIGTLTKELCQRAHWVYALEYDRDLEEASRQVLRNLTNLTWIWGDALSYDLTGNATKREHPDRDLALCGNLPYYITSQILYRALVKRCSWARMSFVVQEEVAMRMAASESSGGFGRLSLWCQYRGTVKIVKRIPAGAFLPRPDVDSCLVTLDLYPKFPLTDSEEEFMDALSRAAFSARRKTLLNSLSTLFPDRKVLSEAVTSCGIDPGLRAEDVGVVGFVTLARALLPIHFPNSRSLG
ncbi:MAG: 16S rRNA (adenine(1518)-N(6)/adenine(1519)-N(6))-dimethyltransferase RsmA [Bacillota bacterium]